MQANEGVIALPALKRGARKVWGRGVINTADIFLSRRSQGVELPFERAAQAPVDTLIGGRKYCSQQY